MKNVKTWGGQDRIRKVYVRVREWRTEFRSGKERTRVRVTAAVVGNSRSKTRDLDRYEERDTQTAVWLHTQLPPDKVTDGGQQRAVQGALEERGVPEHKPCS